MGAPHNTKRYGEQWNQHDLTVMSAEIERYLDLIFDIFTELVPSVGTASGIAVVEPEFLLSLYGKKHSSIECFSVAIVKDLIARGENPVGNPKMADYTKFLKKS